MSVLLRGAMAGILIEVQGGDAVAATEELLTIEGLSGTYEVEGEAEKEGVLVTIATIVGIVGGTITIAKELHQWYQAARKSKANDAARIEKAMIVHNGKRLLLQNATVEQIKQILDA